MATRQFTLGTVVVIRYMHIFLGTNYVTPVTIYLKLTNYLNGSTKASPFGTHSEVR